MTENPEDSLDRIPEISEETVRLANLGSLRLLNRPLLEEIEARERGGIPITEDFWAAMVLAGEAVVIAERVASEKRNKPPGPPDE